MAAQDAIVDATSTIALKRQQRRYAIATLILPIVGMLVLIAALWGTWVTPIDLVLLAVMYTATTIGVSVGFHRLFTHRSFATRPMIRVVLAVLGSMAAEGSLIFWVAAHRRHHRYSDRHGDPHSPHLYAPGLWGRLRGLWHAHAGWLYRHEPTDVTVYAKDLIRDPTMRRVSGGRKFHTCGGRKSDSRQHGLAAG
jgi:stearoyl-CoA desaturase (delta-9 desaturase)